MLNAEMRKEIDKETAAVTILINIFLLFLGNLIL